MASPTWYLRRLQQMTPGEVAWRARSTLRDARDRCSLAIGLLPRTGPHPPGPLLERTLCDAPVGAMPPGVDAVVRRANALLEHRLTFSSLDNTFVGDPIDWNRDHESGRSTPMRFANAINYRNPKVAGDAKLVWDLNRHQHLPVLGRAYRATGDARYARAGLEHLASWIQQCPFGRGMNWRSPLELAIRVINWLWFLDLIAPSHSPEERADNLIRRTIELHIVDIARKYSRGSSANNHLIGEAAGVFIASSVIPGMPRAAIRRNESRQLLQQAIVAQAAPDGGSTEHALGYHFFALEFFLLAGIVARRTGEDLGNDYWQRLAAMVSFADAFTEAGPPPLFGDADDGFVLDTGDGTADFTRLVALGCALCGHAAPRTRIEPPALEPIYWLLGADAAAAARSWSSGDRAALVSQAFPESGYYLLQWQGEEARDRVSVFFDCAELGFGSIAAHGHADALQFTLRAFGEEVFVDPGTYDYFTFPEWRDYFRSTRAHNTISVDDRDQSVMHGPFLWGPRARARCLTWEPAEWGGAVAGEHDGYCRLPDPVRHARRLELDRRTRSLTITDDVTARGTHLLKLHFHLSAAARVRQTGPTCLAIDAERVTVTLELDARLRVAIAEGGDRAVGGWVSRRYHHRTPSMVVTATMTTDGPAMLVSRINIGDPR